MEEKCMGLKKEVALQEKQTGDVDRQLDETTRELHREREKLMAVIRMSGDLIFEYDIVNDKMYYAGPGEGILYSRQITEGYTDQLLKEAGNRTETVEQQLAEALRSGNLGVMDYYRMQNVQADTAMKNNVGNTDLSKVFHKEQCIETKDN